MPFTAYANYSRDVTYTCSKCGHSWTVKITGGGSYQAESPRLAREMADTYGRGDLEANVRRSLEGKDAICPQCNSFTTAFLQSLVPLGFREAVLKEVAKHDDITVKKLFWKKPFPAALTSAAIGGFFLMICIGVAGTGNDVRTQNARLAIGFPVYLGILISWVVVRRTIVARKLPKIRAACAALKESLAEADAELAFRRCIESTGSGSPPKVSEFLIKRRPEQNGQPG
jgi:hypothetical protein